MSFEPEPPLDERMAEFVDGCMSDKDRDRFVAELRVNPQLQRELDEYERTVNTVRRALRAPTMEVDIASRVMASLASEACRGSTRSLPGRSYRLLFSAAAAAALLTLAVWLNSLPTKTSPAIESSAHVDAKPGATAADEAQRRAEVSRQGSLPEAGAMSPGDPAGEVPSSDVEVSVLLGSAAGSDKDVVVGGVESAGAADVAKAAGDARARIMTMSVTDRAGSEAGRPEAGAPNGTLSRWDKVTVPEPTSTAQPQPGPARSDTLPTAGNAAPVEQASAAGATELLVTESPSPTLGFELNDESKHERKAGAKAEPEAGAENKSKAGAKTGSDDFFFGSGGVGAGGEGPSGGRSTSLAKESADARPQVVGETGKQVPSDRQLEDSGEVVVLPFLRLTRFVEPPRSQSAVPPDKSSKAPATGGNTKVGAPAGPSTPAPAGPSTPAPSAPSAPAGTSAPTGPATFGPTGPRYASRARRGDATRLANLDTSLVAFVEAELGLEALKRDSSRADGEANEDQDAAATKTATAFPWQLKLQRIGAQVRHFAEAPLFERGGERRRAEGTEELPAEHGWLVEGPKSEVQQLIRHLAVLAKERDYELANGELQVVLSNGPPAEREGEGQGVPVVDPSAAGDRPDADPPTRVVLRFRTLPRK
ncbi:MAG: hypothetical protein KDC98_17980 [Planctomycetes bacterium]|nr:hypothetical protein [Planctomycetota bacterium]